jgi:hypothetical protein
MARMVTCGHLYPNSREITPARNLVLHVSGLKENAKEISIEIENLYMFFNHEMTGLVVHTNQGISHQRENCVSIQSYMGHTCEEEI